MEHTNGERFEQKNYKPINAVDRNGRLIPFVTIYVPVENKGAHGHSNDNQYYKLMGPTKYRTDPKRTVLRLKFDTFLFLRSGILLRSFHT